MLPYSLFCVTQKRFSYTMGEGLREIPEHHIQQEFCTTRPLYRRGKKLTSVKVYTINNESQHLLLYRVPKVNLLNELKAECLKFGELKNFNLINEYKVEPFTECYHAHFERIQSARIAKRVLDNKSFYGEILHVCYAPEYETVAETREKLLQRQRDVLSRLEPGPSTLDYLNMDNSEKPQPNRKRKHPALPITEDRLRKEHTDNIWKNVPADLDPRVQSKFNPKTGFKKHFQIIENVNKGPEYGPQIPSNLEELKQPEESIVPPVTEAKPIHTTLLPTTVIKNYKFNYNKKIVFRNKNKD